MAAQIFSVPANIPKGTAVADAFRIAPDFSTLGATGVDAQGNLISNSSYKNYGPGMQLSPFYTYNITPFATSFGNIVASTGFPQRGWMTLTAVGGCSALIPASNTGIFPPGAPNQFYVQLDWPRVPFVQVLTANLTAPVNVTIFGFDYYDQPLQHTYTVQNIGIYPRTLYSAPVSGSPVFPVSPTYNGKAFYKITGVYFNGSTPTGGQIAVTASNIFGLPYVLSSLNNVVSFKWDSEDMIAQGGVAELTDGNIVINTPVTEALVASSNITLNGGNNFQSSGFQVSLASLVTIGSPGFLNISTINQSIQAGLGNFTIHSSDGADASRITWSIPNGGFFLLKEADPGLQNPTTTQMVSTAFTGDVRGLIQLPYLAETWQVVSGGNEALNFSYYGQGFDQQLNILNAGGQPQLNGVPGPNGNNIVPPNKVQDMYGVPQYYTGIPA